ncbi:MAG: hypothetical protein Q4F12_02805 [Erysipelotrichaceae bacterium]|nr:hypothetical protein [Erysipelotrichaceae bacterium]
MKKALVLLIIISIGLLGYDGYIFYNIQNQTKKYEEIKQEYNKLSEEEINKSNEITKLTDELSEYKENNIDTNKEYNLWMNVNKNVQDLLK